MNARIKTQSVNPSARKRIEHLNSADMILYHYFREKFERQLAEYNADLMQAQVRYLKHRRQVWYKFCVDRQMDSGTDLVWAKTNVRLFHNRQENSTACRMLTGKELDITEMVRSRQLRLYPGSVYQDKKSFITSLLS